MLATFLTTKKAFKNRGFSLVEIILYILFLTVVTGVIVQMLISMGGVYQNIKITRELESSGTVALENIIREIRNASSVKVSDSILGSSPGKIVVSGVDDSSNLYEIAFSVNSGTLQISKDGEVPVALTSASVLVNRLLFTRIATSTSEAVRIELEVSNNGGPILKNEKFYGFTILRGSY